MSAIATALDALAAVLTASAAASGGTLAAPVRDAVVPQSPPPAATVWCGLSAGATREAQASLGSAAGRWSLVHAAELVLVSAAATAAARQAALSAALARIATALAADPTLGNAADWCRLDIAAFETDGEAATPAFAAATVPVLLTLAADSAAG